MNYSFETISGKVRLRTPMQSDIDPVRYKFLNLINAEPNLGIPKDPGTIGGLRYMLLSNTSDGLAPWRVWSYLNPKIAIDSIQNSLAFGDNATINNANSFVFSNYKFTNNNPYNSQTFSDYSYGIYSLSGIFLYNATTIGDPASATYFVVTETGNVGIKTDAPAVELTVSGSVSANGSYTSFGAGRATGTYSFAEGNNTLASGSCSHAEGLTTVALGSNSHSEGDNTRAEGNFGSHAEGNSTKALGTASHAEGLRAEAKGEVSHAAGIRATAAQNYTYAWSDANLNTLTANVSTTRTGQYMVSASGGVFIPGNVGIGTDANSEKLTISGSVSANGNLTIDGNSILGNANTDQTTINAFAVANASRSFVVGANTFTVGMSSTEAIASNKNLFVFDSVNFPSDPFRRVFSDGGNLGAATGTTMIFGTNSEQHLRIRAGGSTNSQIRMTILSSGEVGIGTTIAQTAGANLTVVGTISASSTITSHSLSAREATLVHSPVNDGVNPSLSIGEYDTSVGNAGFSGFKVIYNEANNNLQVNNNFDVTETRSLNIDRLGRVNVLSNRLTVAGTVSALSGIYHIGNPQGVIPVNVTIPNVNLLASVGTRTVVFDVPPGMIFTGTTMKLLITSSNQTGVFTTGPSIALTRGDGNKIINDVTLSNLVGYGAYVVGDVASSVNSVGVSNAHRNYSTDNVGVSIGTGAYAGGTFSGVPTLVATVLISGEYMYL